MLRGTAMEKFKILKVLFNPLLLPYPVTWWGILNNIGAEAKGIYISHSPPIFPNGNTGGEDWKWRFSFGIRIHCALLPYVLHCKT